MIKPDLNPITSCPICKHRSTKIALLHDGKISTADIAWFKGVKAVSNRYFDNYIVIFSCKKHLVANVKRYYIFGKLNQRGEL